MPSKVEQEVAELLRRARERHRRQTPLPDLATKERRLRQQTQDAAFLKHWGIDDVCNEALEEIRDTEPDVTIVFTQPTGSFDQPGSIAFRWRKEPSTTHGVVFARAAFCEVARNERGGIYGLRFNTSPEDVFFPTDPGKSIVRRAIVAIQRTNAFYDDRMKKP